MILLVCRYKLNKRYERYSFDIYPEEFQSRLNFSNNTFLFKFKNVKIWYIQHYFCMKTIQNLSQIDFRTKNFDLLLV